MEQGGGGGCENKGAWCNTPESHLSDAAGRMGGGGQGHCCFVNLILINPFRHDKILQISSKCLT